MNDCLTESLKDETITSQVDSAQQSICTTSLLPDPVRSAKQAYRNSRQKNNFIIIDSGTGRCILNNVEVKNFLGMTTKYNQEKKRKEYCIMFFAEDENV